MAHRKRHTRPDRRVRDIVSVSRLQSAAGPLCVNDGREGGESGGGTTLKTSEVNAEGGDAMEGRGRHRGRREREREVDTIVDRLLRRFRQSMIVRTDLSKGHVT